MARNSTAPAIQPELTVNDFHIFPRSKESIPGTKFDPIEKFNYYF